MNKKIIGLILFIISTFFIISFKFGLFLDIISMVYVLLTPFTILIAKYEPDMDKIKLWKIYRKNLIPIGAIGTVTGLVLAGSNIGNPKDLGSYLAIALLTMFWALILYVIITIFIDE